MKLCSLISVVFLSLGAMTGCVGAANGSDPGVQSAPSMEGPVSSPPTSSPSTTTPLPSHAPTDLLDQSIYLIKNPESRLALGRRVVVSGPNVRITAATILGDMIWIQEAGDQGSCEDKQDVVAWRAIAVRPKTPVTTALLPGQRVEVTGVVAEREGQEVAGRHHRILEEAVITKIDEPIRPFEPHCERNGAALASDALDGVLVKTAGTTESFARPSNGSWSLAPCFGGVIEIGSTMTVYEDWSPSWHWVTGVIDRNGASTHLEPRDELDILGQMHDDVCL